MKENAKEPNELSIEEGLHEVAEFAADKLLSLGAQEAIVLYRLDDELRGRLKCTRHTQAQVALKLLMDSGMPMLKLTPGEAKDIFGFVSPEEDEKGGG